MGQQKVAQVNILKKLVHLSVKCILNTVKDFLKINLNFLYILTSHYLHSILPKIMYPFILC